MNAPHQSRSPAPANSPPLPGFNIKRNLSRILWLVAACCFLILSGAALLSLRSTHAAQTFGALSLDAPTVSQNVAAGTVIGRVAIPALHLSVPMTAGVETSSLLQGVGHVEGTAMPGGLGTIALAGHRDTYLRPLEKIAKGMDIQIVDKTGVYHYQVDRWEVVKPEDVSSLAIRSHPELVLITCYPFHYIGPAPERFVVHALLVSVSPDA